MHCPFIFYGTLMDMGLLHKVTELIPSAIRLGYIKATMFIVTDQTEPHGLHRYPLAVIEELASRAVALHVDYELFPKQISELWSRLLIFEGPLYEAQEISFYCINGEVIKGQVFAAKKDFDPKCHPEISQLSTSKNTYFWTNENTP